MSDRYSRQALIGGWDQSRLSSTRVIVVGSGWLARMVSLLCTAMGFGSIRLVGTGRVTEDDQRFLISDVPTGTSVARTWAEALRAVEPEAAIDFVHGPCTAETLGALDNTTVVIDASTSVRSKATAARETAQVEAHLICAACGPQLGLYQVGPGVSRQFLSFKDAEEDPLAAMVLAALVVEDARRLRMPLGAEDRVSRKPVLVSPEALHRRGGGAAQGHRGLETPARIALVGAGALGTWVGIGLGLHGRRSLDLTVYDPDGIEETNLNRQVLFVDAVHEPKAEVLARKLSDQFPRIGADGKIQAATEANLAEVFDADLVISGPDNFAARALLHRGAVASGTPLVNGGTSAFGADVAAYVPGRSPCLECSLKVETLARRLAVAEHRARCAGVPEASVVTSNALAGGLMAYEALAALDGNPVRGVIEYDGQGGSERLGVRSVREACGCGDRERQRQDHPPSLLRSYGPEASPVLGPRSKSKGDGEGQRRSRFQVPGSR